MRVMIDILHPAHVHFFKNFYFGLIERGHEVVVTAREKDHSTDLLERVSIPHQVISRSGRRATTQLFEFISRSWKFTELARQFRPDVLTGIMGPTISVVGKRIRCPAYVFYDTEFAKLTNRFVYPLSTKVITPDCYQGKQGRNHLRYPGYHELAYLHPSRFTPDPSIVSAAGIDPDEPFAVVRFVGWWATHDRHERGLTPQQKIQIVRRLEKHCRVILTSESEVPDDLRENVYKGPVELIHHTLAFAKFYYGESATMASECAVLGVPSIYIAKTGRGYTDDEAKYGLVFNFEDTQFDESLEKALELAQDLPSSSARDARDRLLRDKIDVTQFMLEMFETDFGVGQRSTHDVSTVGTV